MYKTIFIIRKEIWVGWGGRNGNFALLHILKMFLRKGMSGSKKAQNPFK